jgi:hypothetical protein
MDDPVSLSLIDAGHLLIITLFPALFVFSPTLSRFVRSDAARFLMSIIVTWGFLVVFWRPSVELPIALARARAAGDTMYDGVGGNVAVLLFGWLEPLLFGCPFLIAKMIINRRKNPNNVPDHGSGSRADGAAPGAPQD